MVCRFTMAVERAEDGAGEATRLPRLRRRDLRRRLPPVLLAPLYRTYTARLRRRVRRAPPPNHVAVRVRAAASACHREYLQSLPAPDPADRR
jgi:hypothetical protein